MRAKVEIAHGLRCIGPRAGSFPNLASRHRHRWYRRTISMLARASSSLFRRFETCAPSFQDQRVPLHHLSVRCIEGSTFTASYAKNYECMPWLMARPFARDDNLELCLARYSTIKKYLKLKILRSICFDATWRFNMAQCQLTSSNQT
jgi:hypothetical protein